MTTQNKELNPCVHQENEHEKPIVLFRMKDNGTVSIHKLYVDSKQEALACVWEDEADVVGKFVADRAVLPIA